MFRGDSGNRARGNVGISRRLFRERETIVKHYNSVMRMDAGYVAGRESLRESILWGCEWEAGMPIAINKSGRHNSRNRNQDEGRRRS